MTTSPPTVGDLAPQFSLPDQNNCLKTIPEQNGKWLVIYFFPKAMTSGCTVQARRMQAQWLKWAQSGVEIVGLSAETTQRQRAFASKEGLIHPLLADSEHTVAELYGVWQKKSMYGRSYMGVARNSFIIDPNGRVAHIFVKATPATHAEDIAAWFAAHTDIKLTISN